MRSSAVRESCWKSGWRGRRGAIARTGRIDVWPPRSWEGELAGRIRARRGANGEEAYPDIEVQVLVGDGLDVEADCRNRRDYLANLHST